MKNDFRENEDYTARINRVIDYIESNLIKDLKLEDLAGIANFSVYHFHRVFKHYTGETLHQFITRLRLEKAANMLIQPASKSITEIVFDCGFSGSAVFARAFKDYYQTTASNYRKVFQITNSKNCKTESKIREEVTVSPPYFTGTPIKQIWSITMSGKKELNTDVQVKNLDPVTVAYVRNIGPYELNQPLFEKLFGKLFNWAAPRGLVNNMPVCMTVYHDDYKRTDPDKLRISVCLEVPETTEISGDIGKMNIPGGLYACAYFEIHNTEYGDAWAMVLENWLPESGYVCDDRPTFEIYKNDPKTHPEGIHFVEIYVPVKPA